MKRRALLVGIAALGFASGMGCRSDVGGVGAPEDSAAPPSEGMRGVSLRNFREGDTSWVLQSDSASVFRDRKRVETEAVAIDFFDGDEHVSKLTADKGVLMQATDDLEARGNVRVVTEDGAILKTEVLFWDHQRARIYTDEPVEIQRGADVLAGVGMEADPGLTRVELKRSVRGTVKSNPEQLLPGESEG
jgi:LPS export ABC transporter protein LptC